jgi:hypothetical protein
MEERGWGLPATLLTESGRELWVVASEVQAGG